jgi:hypothetical protein
MNLSSLRRQWLAALATALALGAAPASASYLLLDRGLPTANHNDAAGASRANVRWWSGSFTSTTDYVVEGDTVKNTTGSTWTITTLRLWVPDVFDTLALYGGLQGAGSHPLLSTSYTSTAVKYSNGENYTDFWGANDTIFQIDFAVNVLLMSGQTLEFFFDGFSSLYNGPPFLHASNAALSGSPQQGADGQMLEARLLNGAIVSSSVIAWDPVTAQAWDKVSDFNVQALGTAVPLPGTLAMAGLGLMLAGAVRRRRA